MERIILSSLYGDLMVPDWPGDLIVRSLVTTGEWAAAEAMVASALLDPGGVVWDAGAFLGTFALGLAGLVTPGNVLAIEANPVLATSLRRNLELLPCPGTLAVAGLGHAAGWLVPLDSGKMDNHGSRRYRYTADSSEDGIPCHSLAELRAAYPAYDMLKLDLEGMEREVLLGDVDYLRTRRPVIWAECNETHDSLKLFSTLRWLGYDVAYVAFPAFRRNNFRKSDKLIYPMAYEAALVAAPQEQLAAFQARASGLVPGEDILCRPLKTTLDLRRAMFDTPRWCSPDWLGMSRAELIARLGRVTRRESLKQFLAPAAEEPHSS